MNLDAVIIVLREVLEAAVLGSLLMALSHRRQLGQRWFWMAILLGMLGAWAYASAIGPISELWDYTGQEMVNATMQGLIFLGFLVLLVNLRGAHEQSRVTTLTMGAIITLALTRELSEILLYLQGYMADPAASMGVFAGAAVGAITGSSVGIALYVLTFWAVDWARAEKAILVTLIVVIAGVVTQAVSLLLQVDRLPHLSPLWDSDHLISERSIVGQLLYALMGYESTPTAWHIGMYVVALGIMLTLMRTRTQLATHAS